MKRIAGIFLVFLQMEMWKQLLLRIKVKIHVETGIFSTTTKTLTKTFIFFFLPSKDSTKKLTQQEFETSEDYNDYIDDKRHEQQ